MKNRILRAVSFFMVISSIMFALAIVTEISHDQSRGGALPRFVQVASYFSPISYGVLIFPILAAFAFFLNTENEEFRITTVLWVLAAGLAFLTVVSGSLTALNHLSYMNGPKPISTGQIIGNSFILVCLISATLWGLLRKKQPIQTA